MKTAFIFVLFETPPSEVNRLKKEIKELRIKNYKLYFIDNSHNHQGYAAGVNQGIKNALKDNCELFVVANSDISLIAQTSLTTLSFFDSASHFDIWGLAMKQENKIYYGGEIDKWRMSGGLIDKKPKNRFVPVDFV